MSKKSTLIILFVIFFTISCGSWKHRNQILSPVWSDDNSDIAYILNSYEFKEHWPTGGDSRNRSFSIYMMDSGLQSKSLLVSDIQGQAGTLFYMKSQKYVIAGIRNADFHMIDSETGELIQTFKPTETVLCADKIGDFQSFFVLPSLHGDKLAVVETTPSCEININFLIQNDNNWTDGSNYKIQGNDFDDLTWVSNDSLLISNCLETCSEEYYLISIDSGVEKVASVNDFYEPCTFINTSSSFVSKDGTELYLDPEERNKISKRSIFENPDLFLYGELSEEYYQPGCNRF
ncbi:hypothetical protein [Gracilimonas sp.]|uniref:hypothetical protein n=1 Tax=Gracilimonas sp. TaxID=1974203 RepID=UPI0032ED8018